MYKLIFTNLKGEEDVKWFSHLEQVYKVDFSHFLKWQIFHNGEIIDSSFLKDQTKVKSLFDTNQIRG